MRINLIKPEYLSDQHLVAEYREIKMLPKCLKRTLASKKGFDRSKISKTYTLNTGHGYFFYDKIQFIVNRFKLLLDEMQARGFATNYTTLSLEDIPQYFFNDYKPTHDEKLVSLDRIQLRICEKPTWYKYYSNPLLNWSVFYDNIKDKI